MEEITPYEREKINEEVMVGEKNKIILWGVCNSSKPVHTVHTLI